MFFSLLSSTASKIAGINIQKRCWKFLSKTKGIAGKMSELFRAWFSNTVSPFSASQRYWNQRVFFENQSWVNDEGFFKDGAVEAVITGAGGNLLQVLVLQDGMPKVTVALAMWNDDEILWEKQVPQLQCMHLVVMAMHQLWSMGVKSGSGLQQPEMLVLCNLAGPQARGWVSTIHLS